MKIWYSVQSTGLGHLIPYRTLAGVLISQGHQLITLTCGPQLPAFFKPLGEKYYHFDGPTLIMDQQRLSYAKTTWFNTIHFPRFMKDLWTVKRLIQAEKPDLIIIDYEPFTSNYLRIWRPAIPSFTVDHQSVFVSPMFPYQKIDFALNIITRLFSHAKVRLCSSFLDYGQKDSFYCIPPIIRSEVLKAKISDDGSILVYHSTATSMDKERIKKICPKDRPILFYGYESEIFGNITFKPKGDDFLSDLAKCHLYVTNCGFFSACEALVLGKRVICQPLKGHAEQEWNGRILKDFKNVKVVDEVDYQNLIMDALAEPDPQQIEWLRQGLEMAMQFITSVTVSGKQNAS